MSDLITNKPGQRRAPISADRIMFPLAAGFALAAIPAWLVARTTSVALPATWHGHEMLFGYALAVVAGFLVTRTSRAILAALIVTWLSARIAVANGTGIGAPVAGLSFAAIMVAAAAPPLLRGAKRGENRIAPVALFTLLLLDAFWWAGTLRFGAAMQYQSLLATIDVLALLMLVVGGRALPAAVGGYLERNGIPRTDMIRSGYEIPLAGLMGLACLADLAGLSAIAGLLNSLAALLTLWRAAHWRLHYTFARAELWSLALAYLWLVPALLLKGIGQIVPVLPPGHLLHAFTIGALGSLTLVMMARTAQLRVRRPIANFHAIGVAVLLLALASVLRLVALPTIAARPLLLGLSAGAWMIAFAILLTTLFRAYRRTATGSGRA